MKRISKKIYVVASNIKFKTFQLLIKKLVKVEGPTAKNLDKVMWNLLARKDLFCWFDPDFPGDMKMGPKLPLQREYFMLSSPNLPKNE